MMNLEFSFTDHLIFYPKLLKLLQCFIQKTCIIYLKKYVNSQKKKVDNQSLNFEVNLNDEIPKEMVIISYGKYVWIPPENRIKNDNDDIVNMM